jgi:hypothetical protein
MVGEALHDRAEIERPVARHGEGSQRHGIEEGLALPVEPSTTGRRMSFTCTWLMRLWCLSMARNTSPPAKARWPASSSSGMPSPEFVHEGVELVLELNHRRHMVVVGERHALFGAPFAERGQLCA